MYVAGLPPPPLTNPTTPHTQGGVDATVTSLTKLFSGRGDVMAGSLVLNGQGHMYRQLKAASECVVGVLMCVCVCCITYLHPPPTT